MTRTRFTVHPPVGVVLAGGNSRRFGSDKALQQFRGVSLAERAANRLRAVADEVVIADRGRQLVLGFRSIEDGPGAGPAAALLGAAKLFPENPLLVLACDLPLVPPALLLRLMEEEGGIACVPRHASGLEPLCALYRPQALSLLERRILDRRSLALHAWIRDLGEGVVFLEADRLEKFGAALEIFCNVNRPKDLPAKEQPG